ncbi:MAG TPA: GNAT family N-acetyltransferase [Pseudomonadales bacterium]|nr:GNAT family N-acetyltransferase [Pseudomonadales bacterium]
MRSETERLLIRSFSIADLPAYAEIVADPRVTKFLADGSPHTYEEAEAYIRDCIDRDRATGISRYAVLRKRQLDLIGFCGFKEQTEYVDFGWRYAHHAWGQGYATEAALRMLEYGTRELGLTNIAAGAFIENIASVKIIQKLGFKRIERHEFYGRPTIRYYQSAVA